MTTGRAGFWAGVALGVTTGAAALYGVLKVWAARWPLPEEGFTVGGSGHQDHVHGLFGEKSLTTSDWCPGVDPSEDGRRVAGRLQASGVVDWKLCGDWAEHEPHLRATDPEYLADQDPGPTSTRAEYLARLHALEERTGLKFTPVADPEERDLHGEPEFAPEPEVWCPGNDPDPHQVYPWMPDWQRTWEPCTATIRHNAHRRWDRRPADVDPGTGAACVHHASESCPEGLSFGEHLHDPEGCHTGGRPHTGPCFTVVDHTPRWALAYGEAMHPPVISPEVMKDFKAQVEEALRSVGEVGPALRKAMAPAADALAAMSPATPTDLVQCWRDYPHTEHIHVNGICKGRTPEETEAPLYRLHDQGLPHPAHGMPWLEACPNCPGIPEEGEQDG